MPCNKTEDGRLVNEPPYASGRAFTDYRSSNDLLEK